MILWIVGALVFFAVMGVFEAARRFLGRVSAWYEETHNATPSEILYRHEHKPLSVRAFERIVRD